MTIVSWNAEGLRSKVRELAGWLPAVKADVVAIQEAQLPQVAPSIPGFQPPIVVRRARGRVSGAATVKGGDVALYVRAGLHFTPLTERRLAATDDSTEFCGVRLLGPQNLDVFNIYRPPIRATGDDREDNFDPSLLPSDDASILVGDVNGHHPSWDLECDAAGAVGERIADWMEAVGWVPLNSGEPFSPAADRVPRQHRTSPRAAWPCQDEQDGSSVLTSGATIFPWWWRYGQRQHLPEESGRQSGRTARRNG